MPKSKVSQKARTLHQSVSIHIHHWMLSSGKLTISYDFPNKLSYHPHCFFDYLKRIALISHSHTMISWFFLKQSFVSWFFIIFFEVNKPGFMACSYYFLDLINININMQLVIEMSLDVWCSEPCCLMWFASFWAESVFSPSRIFQQVDVVSSQREE